MTEPISINVRRGVMKIEAQIHVAAGARGIEEFINALETELLGCAREKGTVIVELPSPTHRPDEDAIPRTGLLDKKQMQRLFRLSRSTLDQRVVDGVIPKGGLDGGRRVWDAETMWALAERMAANQVPFRETEMCKKKSA